MEQQSIVMNVDLKEKEGVSIKIKCKKTKRFLCSLNYDEIISLLEKYGVVLERPLEIVIPCKNCRESEVYHIYKDHYVFKENKKLDK